MCPSKRATPSLILSLLSSGTKRRATQKAASFKTQGILAPLLVRELEESKYEVVAGARRLRAAKLAELERLPVRVVKLTDAEAIEAQCVEKTCNARTSTRLRKLWVSSHSWNSENLPTPSPPSPHALARARRMFTVYVLRNISCIMLPVHLCGSQKSRLLPVRVAPHPETT